MLNHPFDLDRHVRCVEYLHCAAVPRIVWIHISRIPFQFDGTQLQGNNFAES